MNGSITECMKVTYARIAMPVLPNFQNLSDIYGFILTLNFFFPGEERAPVMKPSCFTHQIIKTEA
jgi:hypothetical protein